MQQKDYPTLLDAIVASTPKGQSFIEYQCRDGFCGACRCKLLSGRVGVIKPTLAFLGEDEILPCSMIALSDVSLNTK